jgi:hypothetical protein
LEAAAIVAVPLSAVSVVKFAIALPMGFVLPTVQTDQCAVHAKKGRAEIL